MDEKAYKRLLTTVEEKDIIINRLNNSLKAAYKTIEDMQKEINRLTYMVDGENTER